MISMCFMLPKPTPFAAPHTSHRPPSFVHVAQLPLALGIPPLTIKYQSPPKIMCSSKNPSLENTNYDDDDDDSLGEINPFNQMEQFKQKMILWIEQNSFLVALGVAVVSVQMQLTSNLYKRILIDDLEAPFGRFLHHFAGKIKHGRFLKFLLLFTALVLKHILEKKEPNKLTSLLLDCNIVFVAAGLAYGIKLK